MPVVYLILATLLGGGATVGIYHKPIQVNSVRKETLRNDARKLNQDSTRLKILKLGAYSTQSDTLSLTRASEMTDSFRTEMIFNIPMAWTFERSDIEKIFYDTSINRLKLYAAVKNYNSVAVMTLLAVGYNKGNDTDVVANPAGVTTIYEYADPCPPKCKGSNALLRPDITCFYRQVVSIDNIEILECGVPPAVH